MRSACFASALALTLAGCSSTPPEGTGGKGTTSTTTSSTSSTSSGPVCATPVPEFEIGSADGHPDPTGAKAAKQARAGRIKDLSKVAQPAHGRQRVEQGDFLLVNDKIAVVIEDKGISDGYAPFGGEILTVDKVGDDGRPLGLSMYNETLVGLTLQVVKPDSVSVLKDGSDGKEAIVRVKGPIQIAPFLDGPLKALFPKSYEFEMAYDYILAPGAEKVTIRASVRNTTLEAVNLGADRPDKDEFYGFFQYSRSQMVTVENGYAKPPIRTDFLGFDNGSVNFAWKGLGGPLHYGVEQSGFTLFWGDGFVADPCAITGKDRIDLVAGGADYDSLREAVRRSSGETAWREIKGTLKDGKGAPVEGAWIHGKDATGAYVTRTKTDATGAFTVHAPPSDALTIIPQKRGYPEHQGTSVAAQTGTADLTFAPHATVRVVVVDEDLGTPVPARVQIVPAVPPSDTPDQYGVPDEQHGRLHQELAVSDTTLVVPPGQHRILVSRGYEWEMFDKTITVNAGEAAEITAPIAHSVDTTGVMCADFHIHSIFSADSNDSVENKVKGAVADGLDIPVSSEHEWVIDFQPIVKKLGFEAWAFGAPSSELTTFTWGHFGVLPLTPRDEALNHGAVNWIGKNPSQVFSLVHSLPEKPVLIVNHPRSSGFGGYFSSAQYDRASDKGGNDLWSPDFEAIEVFNDSDFEDNRQASVADWFAMLNHGKTIWAVGSSDSHHLRTSPLGYPRTCLYFGHDDPKKLSPTLVRDAVASGASTISGGLYMTVTGPNGERPGQSIVAADGKATFLVTVETASFIPADTLEIIVDGKTVSEEPLLPIGTGKSKRFANQVTVEFDPKTPRSWVVFHAKGNGDLAPLHPGRSPFAVSNPVFLKGS